VPASLRGESLPGSTRRLLFTSRENASVRELRETRARMRSHAAFRLFGSSLGLGGNRKHQSPGKLAIEETSARDNEGKISCGTKASLLAISNNFPR